MTTDAVPAWMDPSDSIEVAEETFAHMAEIQDGGGRIIIGMDEAIPAGEIVIEVMAGDAVIKRRATRAEFVANAPIRELAKERAPFYYELLLVRRDARVSSEKEAMKQ